MVRKHYTSSASEDRAHFVTASHQVKYLLHDQAVRFLRGKLRLRQITRLSPNGDQTPIRTSRWDLPAVQVAYRMFERWRQENFFKYLGEEYLIDALVDYQVEPDDPNRSVPNPARKAVEKELRRRRAHLTKLRESYGGDRYAPSRSLPVCPREGEKETPNRDRSGQGRDRKTPGPASLASPSRACG